MDLAVSSDEAFRIRQYLPGATVNYLRGLGHLAHEEQPEKIAQIILEWALPLSL
jgi:magnesium chelatase accessory protein